MKKLKVLVNFIKLAISAKIAFYRNVIAKISGNALFTNPDISIELAKKQVDELEKAALDSEDGSHTQIAIRNAKLELVDATFRKLANYVDRIADGDEAIILSSGFHAYERTNSFSKPELSVKNGNVSGNVKLLAKSIEGAKSYIWQYAKDSQPLNGDGWIIAGYSTKAQFEISELDIAGKYWFRVSGITSGGQTDYCSAVMKVVE